jgi:hypothetical protein
METAKSAKEKWQTALFFAEFAFFAVILFCKVALNYDCENCPIKEGARGSGGWNGRPARCLGRLAQGFLRVAQPAIL